MKGFLAFCRRHAVAVISLMLAALSFLFCPSAGWQQAIDWRTLNLLFCLMFVVAGLRGCNFFRVLAQTLLTGCTSYRRLAHLLVRLTFGLSMFVTNDVALIALVPFAIYLLNRLGLQRRLPGLIVLQSLAANLGSMATPIGNPQNLFLYTAHAIPTGAFFLAMLPITLAGALILDLLTHLTLPDEPIAITFAHRQPLTHPAKVRLYGVLFGLCLLSVFRLVPGSLLFGVVIFCALVFCRKALRQVDFGLLLTFVAFFLFSHNIGQLPALGAALRYLLATHTQSTAVLASQVLSNVPAAILLSPFTSDWRALLWGCDIGGFGTPIASLASLISLNLYLREPDARPWRYLLLFLGLNGVLLAALSLLSCVL